MSYKLSLCFFLMIITGWVAAQDSVFDGLKFSGQWFLAYSVDRPRTTIPDNTFKLKRGYVTVQKKFNDNLSARVTQDIAVDHEGDGVGDIEIRLKYGYLRYTAQYKGFFHKPFVEFGLVHRPWLDFEQKINHYRVQGTMFLERTGMLRSADYGLTFGAMLGGEIDEPYQNSVNSAYPGRYGSFSVGVYNGGGYEAIEYNNNKLIETRLSLRPLPDQLPGFQMSWIGAFGKGNTVESPDYCLNALFCSYDSQWLTLSSTYYKGVGNLKGDAINAQGKSYDHDGYSFFSEMCIPRLGLCPVVRYDYSDGVDDLTQKRYIYGVAYYFYKNSKIMLDVDVFKIDNTESSEFKVYELVVEFKY